MKFKSYFQKRVFEAVKSVPTGKITTYKEIARAVNCKSYRAIGQALKANKNKAVPCHRVICSDGRIGGYGGGGKKNTLKKIKMLKREGIDIRSGKIDVERFIYRLSKNK